MIYERAYAKINLGLDVLRKRLDGYHEVRMVMQTIDLYDELYLKKLPKSEIIIHTNQKDLPIDQRNLVYKTAKLVLDTYHIPDGIEIYLQKNIPMASGMAGGSSDAAAMLRGLNRMFYLGLGIQELQNLGVRIGADVPYCIQGGTCLAEGIGEKLNTLLNLPKMYFVIAKPEIAVSTKYVYENLNVNSIVEHPDIDKVLQGIMDRDIQKIAISSQNILELVTVKKYPIIQKIKEEILEYGALGSHMSGSGPTVFGIFKDEIGARECMKKIKPKGMEFINVAMAINP